MKSDIIEKESKFTKYSLDSDEEDEIDKYKVDSYDIEGEEVSTIDRDGDIKITPFNMIEEQELGVIDKEGTFIFHKEKDQIKDSWLDNIENVKIVDIQKPSTAHLFEGDNHQMPELNPLEHYKAMVEIMQPGETVTKALKRLGGKSNMSSRERWKLKKKGGEDNMENREMFDKLTGLANDILISGNMDVYQYTYEKLKHLIASKEDIKKPLSSTDNDVLDMFAEAFDEMLAAQNDTLRKNSENTQSKTTNGDGEEVQWEFKWENKEDAPVYGPHSNLEMMTWQDSGYFKDGVWVRKAGEMNREFHSSKRVDFELYQ
ncbi:CD2BP2 [Cordylochernes scorpioides]|uniref:CD2BP2 n=1 Tax=Cordylochernes scorpioides TaxID=51811 RepID=A0ABY6LNW7_9ARAC|nr:CD2BP2 [Cordylochernes scorpioides]